jgi:hypothetical protein
MALLSAGVTKLLYHRPLPQRKPAKSKPEGGLAMLWQRPAIVATTSSPETASTKSPGHLIPSRNSTWFPAGFQTVVAMPLTGLRFVDSLIA